MAIETAQRLTIQGRKQLQADGVVGIRRPVHIQAEIVRSAEQALLSTEAASSFSSSSSSSSITKLVHFQRHGQGFHNTICEIWKELAGKPVNLMSHDPTENPMKRPEVLDAPLTEVGRQQCRARQGQAALLNPEMIIVSPLLRTLQTAELSWAAHSNRNNHNDDGNHKQNGNNINSSNNNNNEKNKMIPWIAHEGCREDLGVLICNQRQPVSHIQAVYPHVDFSLLTTDHDTLFLPHRHETALEKANRIYDFLLFLRDLPVAELAVVTHSSWLFCMCNAVLDMKEDDDDASSWFLTSEIRSLRVTFTDFVEGVEEEG